MERNPTMIKKCENCGDESCSHKKGLVDWDISCNHFFPSYTLKIYTNEEILIDPLYNKSNEITKGIK